MKTDVIKVSSSGKEMETALAQVDKVVAYKALSPKGALHLRLLAEEMMGMMRSITGEPEGEFWIEDEDGVYGLHLRVKTSVDERKREKLLSASTSGVNEAERTLMGKLRAFFEPTDDLPPLYYPPHVMGEENAVYSDATWSMVAYREQLNLYLREQRAGSREAWDELEKSVVAHVADDVKVAIRGRTVEMTILKKIA